MCIQKKLQQSTQTLLLSCSRKWAVGGFILPPLLVYPGYISLNYPERIFILVNSIPLRTWCTPGNTGCETSCKPTGSICVSFQTKFCGKFCHWAIRPNFNSSCVIIDFLVKQLLLTSPKHRGQTSLFIINTQPRVRHPRVHSHLKKHTI